MGKKRIAITLVATLILLGSLASIALHFNPTPPAPDLKMHRALGAMLAQEAARLTGSGGKVILVTRDAQVFSVPAVEAQVESCKAALQKSGTALGAIKIFQVDPLRLVAVPPGEFLEILRKGGGADVVISLLGAAVLNDDQLRSLGETHPKIVAVCTGTTPMGIDLKRLFEAKILDVAVISRPGGPAPAGTESEQAAFARVFQLITPSNLADLPPPK